MKTLINTLLVTSMALTYTGCGSSEDGTDSSSTPGTTTYKVTVPFGGGYLENAKVCFDKNQNFKCDADEISMRTDSNGVATYVSSERITYSHFYTVEAEATKTIMTEYNSPTMEDFNFAGRVITAQMISDDFVQNGGSRAVINDTVSYVSTYSAYRQDDADGVGQHTNWHSSDFSAETEDRGKYVSDVYYLLDRKMREEMVRLGFVATPTNSMPQFMYMAKVYLRLTWDNQTQGVNGPRVVVDGLINNEYNGLSRVDAHTIVDAAFAEMDFSDMSASLLELQDEYDNGDWIK